MVFRNFDDITRHEANIVTKTINFFYGHSLLERDKMTFQTSVRADISPFDGIRLVPWYKLQVGGNFCLILILLPLSLVLGTILHYFYFLFRGSKGAGGHVQGGVLRTRALHS